MLQELRQHNVDVSLLDVKASHAELDDAILTQKDCLSANEALLHRAIIRRPLSVLKYAMTLDGKIAASTGHSAWVTSPLARQHVFALRSISDAIVVGGNTVRRDNPNLTTRKEIGFAPTRIVVSQTLKLPSEANLWNIAVAPTIVMTQKGTRTCFQQELRDKGVEVIEFDFLSPGHVADYCYDRGFLQLLWECGGALSAPAISSGVIHKVLAFVAPKIIGGISAPSPCGDLGFVEMTQALPIEDLEVEQLGPDIMLQGYLPSSGGLKALDAAASKTSSNLCGTTSHFPRLTESENEARPGKRVILFYKAWDAWGVLSNFKIVPIRMFNGIGPHGRLPMPEDDDATEWPSVEHYYQAQKFAGVDDALCRQVRNALLKCDIAEEAATIGRRFQRDHPKLLRPDWLAVRIDVMREAVLAKFRGHDQLREILCSTQGDTIVENSPHDSFWGCGIDGKGENHLGRLLMSIRDELLEDGIASKRGRRHSTVDA